MHIRRWWQQREPAVGELGAGRAAALLLPAEEEPGAERER